MGDRKTAGGWATTTDGRHLPLSSDEARALWAAMELAKARRAETMPDTDTALSALCDAKTRLRELGWSDGIYCPKDCADFAAIQTGSTGIFAAFYLGKWPDGNVWIGDSTTPPEAIMWKALADLTDAERTKLNECMGAERVMADRMLRSFSAEDEADG